MREEEIYHIKEILENIESNTWKDEPDYWDKLKHQAAIAAMSAFLVRGCEPKEIAQLSLELAGVMVEKLKNDKQ